MKTKIVSHSSRLWWEVVIYPWVLAVVSRWNNLLEEIAEQLHSSKALLQLWQRYKDYSKQCASTVQQHEDRADELLKAAANKDIADEEVAAWIQDCHVCSGTGVFSQHAFLRLPQLSRARAMCVSFCYVSVCETSYPKIIALSSKEHDRFSEHMLSDLKGPSHCFIFWMSCFPVFPNGIRSMWVI